MKWTAEQKLLTLAAWSLCAAQLLLMRRDARERRAIAQAREDSYASGRRDGQSDAGTQRDASLAEEHDASFVDEDRFLEELDAQLGDT